MIVALVGAMLAGAQPAADADLACIVDRIPASARESLLGEVASGTGGTVRQTFREVAQHCTRQGSWASDYAQATEKAAVAHLLREAALGGLRRAGIDAALITAWIAELPAANRNFNDVGPELLGRLTDRLVAAGVTEERIVAHADEVGLYVVAQLMWEEAAAQRRP